MRRVHRFLLALTATLALLATTIVGAVLPAAVAHDHDGDHDEYEVLFFHLTTGFRHDSIPAAIQAVEELGAEHGFSVTETQDPTVFSDENLDNYAAVVFFTDGENTLNASQRTAFERYIHRGGGFVGLHSTSNMDKTDWPWWSDLMGHAFFANHPPIQSATMHVEDGDHPATAHLGETWEWPDDEWYNFTANPRDAGAHVLLTVDESTYNGGQMGDDHPIAWCNEFDGGRTFYTAIGHSSSHYQDADMRQHILGGIEWAAGVVDGDCGEPREGIPTEAAFEKVALDDNTANPMKMDIAPDGRVFYTELAGTLKVWHPDTQGIGVAGQLDVYRDHENGLMGIALDPDFEENNHIYLFYSDPDSMEVDNTAGGLQRISRFELDPVGETLIMDSEVAILEFPHQRQECCHSSGDLKFDSEGNLYLSTGDDTNPFGSQNFAPIDYRDGRAPWDAGRSSGNTNDLRGKIIRITPLDDPGDEPGLGSTYTVPDDNLFTEANDAYHHLFPNGEYDADLARPEIYVMGLRNPFGIGIDSATDELWIGDVGPDSNPSGGSDPNRGPRGYDSWTKVTEAGNYGWPFCYIAQEPYRQWTFPSGPAGDFYDCENGAVNDSPRNTGLEQLPPATPRTLWYPYCPYTAPPAFPEIPSGNVSGGQNYGCGRAAFMGDVYHFDAGLEAEGKFPEYYDGKPFVIEWERDIIASITMDDGEYVPGSFEEFMFGYRMDDGLRFRKPHDLQFGPDGNMYLIEWGDSFNFGGGGVNPDSGLYRISYVKGGRTPVASASATPDNGQPPLEVSFSSEGSFDPDGEDITYQWNFGDGTTSDDPNPTYTYTEPGVYPVQLVVTDTTDRSSSSSLTITVGNTRPEVTIEFPHHGQIFEWGDEIPYEVTVVDAEEGSTDDGGISCDEVTVQRGLWHSTGESAHVHPGPTQTGCEGVIQTQADADHGEDADIATVITASYTDTGDHPDAQPLTGGVTHLLQPKRKQAQFFDDASDGVSVSAANDSQTGGTSAIAGQNGDWASYEPYNLDGIDQLTLRASALSDTTVEVRRDAPDGELLGTADIDGTVSVDRVDGPDGFGSAVRLNSSGPLEYVEMPEGIVSDVDDFTISAWVDWNGSQTWTRIFDFGSGTGTYMFLTPSAGGTGNMRYGITTSGGGAAENQINAQQPLPTDGWQHVAVTQSGTTGTLYLNGEPVGTNTNMTLSPSDLGATEQNWIGESQWAADPLLNGAVDDFNIFDHALSQEEIQSLMAAPGGGDVGGGNVAWYQFDEDGGTTALDSSAQENHATIAVSDTIASWANVTFDLAETSGTFPLHLVFPEGQARVNWMEFGDPPDDPGDPDDPEMPICEDETVVDRDDFEGDGLDENRWTVVEPDAENLSVEDGQLNIQTVLGRDFFAGDGTLPNVVVQDLPDGAWTATTSMNWTPAQNYQNAGLVVWVDEEHYVKAGMVHNNGRAFELIKEVSGSPSFEGNVNVGGDFPSEFQLRYVYDGDTLEAQFSADGDSWTSIGTTDLGGLDDPSVGVYATNSTSADATEPPVASYNWFSLEFAGDAAERSVSDDFSGSELDGCRWDRVVRYDTDLLDVSDGALHITTTDQDIFGGNNTDLPNLVLQEAPEGDWSVETKMHAPLERNWQNAGLLVYDDDDNYLKAGFVATNQPGEPRAVSAEVVAEVGAAAEVTNDAAPDDVDDWWLRLTKQGDTYTFEWRPDSTAEWTTFPSSPSISLEDPAFGVYATGSSSQQDDQEITVSWQCFALAGEDEDVCPESDDPGDPPEVSAALDPDEPDGDAGWYVSPVTVTLTADDGADVEYRLGGDEWLEYDEPVTVDEDGEHTVEYRASNESGTSDVGSVSVSLDQAPPETSATLDGDEDGDGYVGPVTVTLAAEDATSGVGETHYRMAGDDEPVEYDEPFVVMGEGEQTVEFRSVDVAGNVEEWQQVTFDVAPLECPEPDDRETVVVGGVDSGVVNRDVGNGCTINDLIVDREEWPNQGAFVRHVREVTGQLVDDGVITAREGRDINRAAAQNAGRGSRGSV
ncbi:ThuA domain-containing protein [Phytoactinopolyspora mesophila]|nr:ThuA domain-containing protein [Phytoactinopolyspora mesophila]